MHKELAECINLEDVAKELNDHAANLGHFPPKKTINFFIGGERGRVAVYGMK